MRPSMEPRARGRGRRLPASRAAAEAVRRAVDDRQARADGQDHARGRSHFASSSLASQLEAGQLQLARLEQLAETQAARLERGQAGRGAVAHAGGAASRDRASEKSSAAKAQQAERVQTAGSKHQACRPRARRIAARARPSVKSKLQSLEELDSAHTKASATARKAALEWRANGTRDLRRWPNAYEVAPEYELAARGLAGKPPRKPGRLRDAALALGAIGQVQAENLGRVAIHYPRARRRYAQRDSSTIRSRLEARGFESWASSRHSSSSRGAHRATCRRSRSARLPASIVVESLRYAGFISPEADARAAGRSSASTARAGSSDGGFVAAASSKATAPRACSGASARSPSSRRKSRRLSRRIAKRRRSWLPPRPKLWNRRARPGCELQAEPSGHRNPSSPPRARRASERARAARRRDRSSKARARRSTEASRARGGRQGRCASRSKPSVKTLASERARPRSADRGGGRSRARVSDDEVRAQEGRRASVRAGRRSFASASASRGSSARWRCGRGADRRPRTPPRRDQAHARAREHRAGEQFTAAKADLVADGSKS